MSPQPRVHGTGERRAIVGANEKGPSVEEAVNVAKTGFSMGQGAAEVAMGKTDEGAKHIVEGSVQAVETVVPGAEAGHKVADKVIDDYVKDNTPAGTPPIGGVVGAVNYGLKDLGEKLGDAAYKAMPPEKIEKGWEALKHAVEHPIDTVKHLQTAAPPAQEVGRDGR
jgi:hypothetical protein